MKKKKKAEQINFRYMFIDTDTYTYLCMFAHTTYPYRQIWELLALL